MFKNKNNLCYKEIAKMYNIPVKEVKKTVASAIESKKNNEDFKRVFGNRTPSVDEYIAKMMK